MYIIYTYVSYKYMLICYLYYTYNIYTLILYIHKYKSYICVFVCACKKKNAGAEQGDAVSAGHLF